MNDVILASKAAGYEEKHTYVQKRRVRNSSGLGVYCVNDSKNFNNRCLDVAVPFLLDGLWVEMNGLVAWRGRLSATLACVSPIRDNSQDEVDKAARKSKGSD